MSRSLVRIVALIGMVGALGLAAFLSFGPDSADAQATQPTQMWALDSEVEDGLATASIMLRAGDDEPSSLKATVTTPDGFVIESCNATLGDVKACVTNEAGDAVFGAAMTNPVPAGVEIEVASVVYRHVGGEGGDVIVEIDDVYQIDGSVVASESISGRINVAEEPPAEEPPADEPPADEPDAEEAPATPAGAIKGTVVNAAGISVAEVNVCIRNVVGGESCALTDVYGAFGFGDLPVGNYEVIVDGTAAGVLVGVNDGETAEVRDLELGAAPAGDAPDADKPDADAPDTAPADESGPVPAPAPVAIVGGVTGTVTDATGMPIFGAEVCAEQPVIGTSICVYSDINGHYAISGMETGNWVVSAQDTTARHDGVFTSRLMGVYADVAGPVIDITL